MAGFEFDLWAGLQISTKTPADVAQKLNKAIYEVLQNPTVRNNLESGGSQIGQAMDMAELARMYSAEIARYRSIAKSINLQPQ
jgi:tripartite-type tricarboxylate transporter receptor subunit TctC